MAKGYQFITIKRKIGKPLQHIIWQSSFGGRKESLDDRCRPTMQFDEIIFRFK